MALSESIEYDKIEEGDLQFAQVRKSLRSLKKMEQNSQDLLTDLFLIQHFR